MFIKIVDTENKNHLINVYNITAVRDHGGNSGYIHIFYTMGSMSASVISKGNLDEFLVTLNGAEEDKIMSTPIIIPSKPVIDFGPNCLTIPESYVGKDTPPEAETVVVTTAATTKYLVTTKAADYFKIHKNTLAKWREAGKITFVKDKDGFYSYDVLSLKKDDTECL